MKRRSVWVVECLVFEKWVKYDVFLRRSEASKKRKREIIGDCRNNWRVVRYDASKP
ncbi:MAG: hypothetical protein PVS2B2_26790 [Candidatus Acidiferrum sp.]